MSYIYYYYHQDCERDPQASNDYVLDKNKKASTRIGELLEQSMPIDPEAIRKAFESRIKKFKIEDVIVGDVEVDFEGNITVEFIDLEGDFIEVLFVHDEDEGSLAIVLDDDDDDESDAELVIIDLDALAPPIRKSVFGNYLDVSQLDWMNKTALDAILIAGDIGMDDDDEEDDEIEVDQTGFDNNFLRALENSKPILYGTREDMNELMKTVIRGGKKVRLPVVRKIKRKRLSAKQKAGFRKAARKRKTKSSSTKRKLKKSLKVRKRSGIKKQKLGKFRKVAGTSNRKR